MQLKPGSRLCSQVCETQVMVIRSSDDDDDIDLMCGGRLMLDAAESVRETHPPVTGLDTGAQLGKRYCAADASGLEILVVKGGVGTLTAHGVPLIVKEAKALPASD